MKLITTRDFHYVSVDFYIDGQNNNDFWVTQEQIGEILNYKKPERSIKKLHELFEFELNHLYKEVEINIRRKGMCKTIVYNFKGLIKLCLFSRKSRATESVNFLWKVKFEFEHMQNLPALVSTSQELQLFDYGDKQVRVIKQNQEFWFVAKDVCEILEISNSRDAISELYDSEKADVAISYGSQNRHVNVINEPALYKLIFKSRKPEAKKFQDWVFYEVLPSLRSAGTYSIKSKKILIGKATDTKFYSAIEIGKELGIDDIEVVRIANEHNLLFYGFTKDWDWYFTEEGHEKILNAKRV